MNFTRNKRFLTILGIALMTLAGGLFVWYEWFGGREMINYEDVFVLKEDALEGQLITENLVGIRKADRLSVIDGAVTDINDLVGKQATHFIPANAQLHNSYFADDGLVLRKDQYIAQIPIEWALSIPDTLRRGDSVVVYAATYEKKVLESLQPQTQTENETSQDETSEIEIVEEESTVEEKQSGVSQELQELLATKVAYVKDGANQEVVTTSSNGRMNASSNIHNVEIVTTVDEFKKIEEIIKDGGKLIFMYASDQNDVAEGQ